MQKEEEKEQRLKNLTFRVSSGLKTLIGRELIVDDFIAVFELIKNSFDAHAKKVQLIFEDDAIVIADNGKGMSLDDIRNKWLFVAYSAKQDGTEDDNITSDYRGRIRPKTHYAGAKGVGRFSCDRLGGHLQLATREARPGAEVNALAVSWAEFEKDPQKLFTKVNVHHETLTELGYGLEHGTVLRITSLHSRWERDDILRLKASLAKLISPIEDPRGRRFIITIRADAEKAEDKRLRAEAKDNPEEASDYERHIVNGPVRNFVFQALEIKTTSILTRVSPDGESITTKLVDRGEVIYEIREPNPYKALSDITFSLYYLNRAAKLNFIKIMGLSTTQFGSLFLYKNGFRVQPYGEPGDDSFGYDKRRAQGHSRYLGNRDLFGRIDIYSDSPGFRETTSRDGGLLRTPAYRELKECLDAKCFSRLETYVVGIQWPEKLDKDLGDISLMQTGRARSRIISLVEKISRADGVELLDYSSNLIDVLNTKDEEFSYSLVVLESLAERLGDSQFLDRVREADKRYRELQAAEEEARKIAERERKARETAERKVAKASAEARKLADEKRKTESALEEERKRNLFLTSSSNVDLESVVNLHHEIAICASTIDKSLKLVTLKMSKGEVISERHLGDLIDRISFANNKIQTITKFATKANFRMDASEIEEDLPVFVEQYLLNVCTMFVGSGLSISVDNQVAAVMEMTFRPLEMTMVVDNIVSNAKKARATRLDVTITAREKKIVEIRFADNGKGLDPKFGDSGRVFEKGFTTTKGAGLGLYHVKDIIGRMGGLVGVENGKSKGFCIYVRVAK